MSNRSVLSSIRSSRGAVRRGGRGRLALDVRGLAPLYSGHLPAETLARAGALTGPAADQAAATATFAGAAPSMTDMF